MANPLHEYVESMVSAVESRMIQAGQAPYGRDVVDVLTGAPCDFWPRGNWKLPSDSPKWSNEQELAICVAVRRACAAIGASEAQRWRMVEAVLIDLANEYADSRRTR